MRMIPENYRNYKRKKEASVSLAYNLLHHPGTDKPAAFGEAENNLKTVLMHRGIRLIDDSRSTNVNAAYFTLTRTGRPTVWILWNDHPDVDLENFAPETLPHLKAVVVVGKALVKAEILFGKHLEVMPAKSMRQAVKKALDILEEGDIVLSPATKNIWLYKNQQDLAVAFKNTGYRLL